MAARLFLTKWTYDAINRHVNNPLLEYLTNNNVGQLIQWWYHGLPDPANNYTPNHPWVFCLAYSPILTGAQIEQLGNITGVHLIPALRPSLPLTNIDPTKRQAISTFLTNNGFDISSLNASSTMSDLMDIIVGTITPLKSWNELKSYAANNDADFQ